MLFRNRAAARAAFSLAAARRRALILVYHRVATEGESSTSSPEAIVPVVTPTLLRQHLEALSTVGDFVPLAQIVAGRVNAVTRRSSRIQFGLTFDDDEPSHTAHVAPLLRGLGIPATFFLCGRALNGLGAPWWIRLEARIASQGLARTAAELGIAAQTPAELAARCEGTLLTDRIDAEMPPARDEAVLGREDISRLAAMSGMTIGFHTLRHPVLTKLDPAAVDQALIHGRASLETLCGRRITQFAYPHGKWSASVTSRVQAAGFQLGCRSGQRPVAPTSDPFALGRWEPGAMTADAILSAAALRLNL
jgi:peptidoglycan/xylan/chitin deacetylase (PgdA/CDA1 family)